MIMPLIIYSSFFLFGAFLGVIISYFTFKKTYSIPLFFLLSYLVCFSFDGFDKVFNVLTDLDALLSGLIYYFFLIFFICFPGFLLSRKLIIRRKP